MNSLNDLQTLHSLHQSGALSDAEFEDQKSSILSKYSDTDNGLNKSRNGLLTAFSIGLVIALIALAVWRSGLIDVQPIRSKDAPLYQAKIKNSDPVNTEELTVPINSQSSSPEVPRWVLDKETTKAKTSVPDEDYLTYQTPLLKGPFKKPDRNFGYATRFKVAEQQGVNFAGHYALVSIGCGAQCLTTYAIDGPSGHVIEFPLSGEEYAEIDLSFSPISSLIKAYWAPNEKGMCEYASYNLAKDKFRKIDGQDGYLQPCPAGM